MVKTRNEYKFWEIQLLNLMNVSGSVLHSNGLGVPPVTT